MKNTTTDCKGKKKDQGGQQAGNENVSSSASNEAVPHKGKLKLDASVADQYITYPADLKLLNTAREETG